MDTTPTVQLTHERVDDVPLLLGLLIKLRCPQLLDPHLIPHPHHQGLSQGWLITIWIAFILSHADHRKGSVRAWANGLRHGLEAVTAETIREVDFSDDRLTLVLQPVSDPDLWDRIETDLWGATCEIDEWPMERIRLDRTTSGGVHTIVAGGLMPLGHSKDHRPDWPPLKLMAAAAEPTGPLIACTVHPGDAADDPLDLPIIDRVRALLGRTGLLSTGDGKMAALQTRATLQA